MIREGRMTDAPEIERLIRESHTASKYAGRVGIAPKALDAHIAGMVAQQRQLRPHGTHVAIAERAGKVVGMIVGAFDRVYHIGDKLTANDIWFIVSDGGTVGDTLGLVDSYIAWARSARSCIEVILSWSDALPGAEKIAALAQRKGFAKCGEMFEMRLDMPMAEAA